MPKKKNYAVKKAYTTNRELLFRLNTKIDQFDAKIINVENKVLGLETRIDDLHNRIDTLNSNILTFQTGVDSQFNNHLNTHDRLNKRILKTGVVLIGMIIAGVILNNTEAVAAVVIAALRGVF